jgi:hypothetical protein
MWSNVIYQFPLGLKMFVFAFSPKCSRKWLYENSGNITEMMCTTWGIGHKIEYLSRFGSFSSQKLYTFHQNFVIYMRTILALDWPLLVYIACDILLGLFLYKYLFLK